MKSDRFIDPEIRFSGKFSKTTFETLYMAYRPYFFKTVIFLIVGLFGRMLLVSNANVIGYWVDSFCKGVSCKPSPSFFFGYQSGDYIRLLLYITVSGILMTLFFRIGFSRLSCRAVSQFYDEVTLRTSRFPMKFFDTTPAGRIITRFSSDYLNIFRIFGGPLAEFIGIIFDLLSMLLLMLLASPYYFVVCIFIIGLNYGVFRLNRNKLRASRRDLSMLRGPSISHFAETVQGAATIRIFSKQESFVQAFEKLYGLFNKQKLATFLRIQQFSLQMNAVSALMYLVTGLLGLFLLSLEKATVGSIGVALTFIVLSSANIQSLFEWLAQFEEAMVGVERLDDYLRKEIELGGNLPSKTRFSTAHSKLLVKQEDLISGASVFKTPNLGLSVKNLSFRYGPDLPFVLKDVSFEVKPGERLGIVGKTGSGKTSLIQALFHLYPIDEGSIQLGKYEVRTGAEKWSSIPEKNLVPLQTFREAIALISQDPVLYRGSLRENLVMAANVGDDVILETLKRVGLLEWYLQLKDGLNFQIEERGKNLSMGERQLICMARCLLRETPVVIMDEATSSIDPQSEEILVQATHDFFDGRTQLIIAHRLSTLRYCHRVLWLEQGQVRMIGPTDEVLAEFIGSERLAEVR